MLISRTGIRSLAGLNDNGFTLIELMVVLAILAIMSSVVTVSMAPALKDARMRSGCRMVASSLNYARNYAAAHNTSTRIVFDGERNVEIQVYRDVDTDEDEWTVLRTTAGKKYTLPEGVQVTEILKADNKTDENWIEFTGTGLADPARVEISNSDELRKYITIDQITGRSSIRSEQEQRDYEASDTIQEVR